MKTRYLDPMTVMRLDAARGINGHHNRPSVVEYNIAITKNSHGHVELNGVPIGEKLTSSQSSLVGEPSSSPENNKNKKEEKPIVKTVISENAIKRHEKKVVSIARAAQPKLSERQKAKKRADAASVKKTKEVAKRVRAEVSGKPVKKPAVKKAVKAAPAKAKPATKKAAKPVAKAKAKAKNKK